MHSDINLIIKEANSRSSEDINKAILYLLKHLQHSEDIKEKKMTFDKRIKQLKTDKKIDAEIKFLKYLHEQYLLQEKQKEERKRKNNERRIEERKEKNRKEKEFQEKMRLHELNEKLKSLNWDYINNELNNILSNLRDLFNENNNSNRKKYSFYKELYNNINKQFTELYKLGISYFFKQNYSFKADSNYFKLDELKNIISEFEELESSNSEISIDIAEEFLNTLNSDNEIIEGNIILAIKIAHTIFMNYKKELKENFDDLRQYFDSSVSDELIYVALFVNNNYIESAREFIEDKKNSWNEVSENWEQGTSLNIPINTEFSQQVIEYQSQRKQSEFELLQEYDGKVNDLHETQINKVICDDSEYSLYDFIDIALNDDYLYDKLKNLYKYTNYENINIKIGNFDVFKEYYDKIRTCCHCNNYTEFKKIIIKYKILECFFNKSFSREKFDKYGIDFNKIYKSNNELHNIFILLILFWSNNSNDFLKSKVNLAIYLKIVACVIILYNQKKENKKLTINDILTANMSGDELSKAIQYMQIINKAIKNKGNISNEEYIQIHGKIRKSYSHHTINKYNKGSSKQLPESNNPYSQAHSIENRLASQLHTSTRKLAVAAPPLKQKSHSSSYVKNETLTKKAKAKDEDKIRIIKDIFSRLLNDNFSSQGIDQLKDIYGNLVRVISQYTSILSSLNLLLKISKKSADNYSKIINLFESLPDIIKIMFDVFERTVKSNLKQGIKNLFENITNKIKDDKLKYEREFSEKTFNTIDEMSNEEINEYLKTLEIDKNDFNSKDEKGKIKEIERQFRALSLIYHPNKQKPNSTEENQSKAEEIFKKILVSKESLMKYYKNTNSGPNVSGPSSEIIISDQNNNTEFLKFKKQYLKNHPDFMPNSSNAETFIKKEQELKEIFSKKMSQIVPITVKQRAPKITNLMDFIVSQMNSRVSINKNTSFENAFNLFEPFNELFNDDLTVNNSSNLLKLNSCSFILSVNNDHVLTFNSEIVGSFKNNDTYMKIIFMIDILIKYIKYKIEFINHSSMNDTEFSNLVYYNFFHYLNRLLLIIMDFLTNSNSKYSSFKNYQTELAKIIKHSDKSLYVIDIEKNKSTQQFKPNTVNSKKFRQNEMKQLRSELIDEIEKMIDSNNNQNNSNLNNKIKKLVEKIIKEKQINFKFLKDNDEIKRRISKFLKLLKTTLYLEIERTNYNLSNLNNKTTVKDKFDFFKEKIFKEVYSKLVEKLNKFNKTNKNFKKTIIEFLYIFIICFSDKFHTFENIKSNRFELKQLGQQINTMLDKFKEQKMKESGQRLYINGITKHLQLLEGTHAKPEQIATSLQEESVKLMKKHKITNENIQKMNQLQLLPAELSVKLLTTSSNASPAVNKNSNVGPAVNKNSIINNLKAYESSVKGKKENDYGLSVSMNNSTPKPPIFKKKNGDIIDEVIKQLMQKLPKDTKIKLKLAHRDKIDKIIEKIKSNKNINITSIDDYIEKVKKGLEELDKKK